MYTGFNKTGDVAQQQQLNSVADQQRERELKAIEFCGRLGVALRGQRTGFRSRAESARLRKPVSYTRRQRRRT